MKPGDRYRHRESGVIVTMQAVKGDRVRYKCEKSRIVYEAMIWDFLAIYEKDPNDSPHQETRYILWGRETRYP